MTRRLVVTADDLGLDPDTNEAIAELLADGLLSATTLMPVAPAADDAVRRVLAAGLPVPHLHVTLTGAREFAPWHPLAPDVPSLTDPSGAFHLDPARVERAGTPRDVAREVTAQLAWMRAAGLGPSALDSHSGTLYGMHGRSFADVAVELCAEHDLALRIPRRLSRVVALALRGRFRREHARAVALADALGVRLPEVMVGSWLPGRMILGYPQLRAEVLAQLRALPEGTSELVLHPAPKSAARRLAPAEGKKRLWELRLLRDPALARTLRRERIELVPGW
ncbi:carbohydrate deacetylase [Georgenia sp. SYP-B2076]|uniref:carbohydrate deacetylase n=1 Tax=Georgenia sp. SYP-B2076 TaxID=2495881 RepID=UPI000F8CD10B|nr:ChbG/HpnK family deacetylase [Georgenia sp. SYP-B2076]